MDGEVMKKSVETCDTAKRDEARHVEKTCKESPHARAERAYEAIRQTTTINDRLREIGIIAGSHAFKK